MPTSIHVHETTHNISEHDWAIVARRLHLSQREAQIIRGLVAEKKDQAIGAELGMSTHTVRTHLKRLSHKLKVHTRVGIVVRVLTEFLQWQQPLPPRDRKS